MAAEGTSDGGERTDWHVTVALGLAALAARLLYWWSTRAQVLGSDAATYHELGEHLAEGRGFVHWFPQFDLHPTAFRPPVFPGLLGLVYRVTGASPGVARAVAVAVGVAMVVVLHRTLRRHVPTRAATIGAALVALCPWMVANDTVPLTEGLSLLLLVLLIDAAVADRPVVAGGLCGALVLTRPSAQGLVVVLVLWLWARVGWRRASVAALCTVAVVLPWMVRNLVQVDTFTVVTSNGFNLAAMYSPEADRRDTFVDPVVDAAFDDIRLLQFDEAAWEAELRAIALAHLRERPQQVIEVVHRNLQATFELDPGLNEGAERADLRNMEVRDASLWAFYLVTVVGPVGLWRGRRNPFVGLLGLSALLFTATSLVMVAPPRLRAPLDLACCVGVALVVDEVIRRRSEPVGAGAALP